MVSQKMTFDLQQRIADLQADYFRSRKEQADRDEKLTLQIAALGQIHHNEDQVVAKSEASGTNWQALAGVVAAVISALALLILVLDKLWSQ